jgi:hypothetical protein
VETATVNIAVDKDMVDRLVDEDVIVDIAEDVIGAEFVRVCACRFNAIVPGPAIVTIAETLEPEQTNPPEQPQLERM